MSQVLNTPHIVAESLSHGEQTYAPRLSRCRRSSRSVLHGGAGLPHLSLPGLARRRWRSSATAVTEVTLKGRAKAAAGFGAHVQIRHPPAMLIHHEDGRWVAHDRGLHPPRLHGAIRAAGRPHSLRLPRRRLQPLHRRQRQRAAAQAAQALQSRRQRNRRRCFSRVMTTVHFSTASLLKESRHDYPKTITTFNL